MAAGLQTKEIAARCNLANSRTSELIAEVLHLTKTRNWAAAVLAAVEEGWIEPQIPSLSSHPRIKSQRQEPGEASVVLVRGKLERQVSAGNRLAAT